MKYLFWSAVMPGFLLAQSQSTGPQSWSGLLVAASCHETITSSKTTGKTPAEAMNRSTPTSARREQNGTYEQVQNQADRGATSKDQIRDRLKATDEVRTPPVDSLDTRGSAPLTGERSDADEKAFTQHMDASCRIGEKTTAFALRLSDSSLLKFDESSNAKIAHESQMAGRLKHKTKIFRATAKGTLEGDSIRLDSIKM